MADNSLDQLEDAQELSESQYKEMFNKPRKDPKKKKPKPKPKIVETPVLEPAYFENPTLSEQEMQAAENEVSERQVVEWKEKLQPRPESEVEVSAALMKVDARMAVKKELIPARAPDGTMRNTALSLEEDYPEPFTDDIVKGNFDDSDRANVFGHISIINALKTIGQSKKFSFVDAARFNKAQLDAIVNTSRAKGGFTAILVKTDKHVSEGVVQHVQRAFIEKKQRKWGVF